MTTLQAIIPDDIHEAVNSQRSTFSSQPASTGLDSLQKLPVAEQAVIESGKAKGGWK